MKRTMKALGCLALLFFAVAQTWSGQANATGGANDICSKWHAWRDSQPIGKPRLHVMGKCTFPHKGYSVKLQPPESPGINPDIYVLDLKIHIPVDKPQKEPENVDVPYVVETDKVYSQVQIMPQDPNLSKFCIPEECSKTLDVKEISKAKAEASTTPAKTIHGCVYSIEDCTVFVTKEGKYYHLSGPSDEVAKANAAKTVVAITAKPGTWDESSAACKSADVEPISIESLTVTKLRCASAPAKNSAVK